MVRINVFDDGRKIPKLSVNLKIKIKSNNSEELNTWNRFFGYIMKKPRTKLEFLAVNEIRELSLNNITVEKLKEYVKEEDYLELVKVENIFNKKLTSDIKAFILSILRISLDTLKSLI